ADDDFSCNARHGACGIGYGHRIRCATSFGNSSSGRIVVHSAPDTACAAEPVLSCCKSSREDARCRRFLNRAIEDFSTVKKQTTKFTKPTKIFIAHFVSFVLFVVNDQITQLSSARSKFRYQ